MEMAAEEANMKNLPDIENQIQQNSQNEFFLITDTGGFNFINNCINKYKPKIWTTLEDPNSSKIAQVIYIYLFKVNNRNFRNRCKICSKLTIKTPKRRQRCRSGVFIVNFEHI